MQSAGDYQNFQSDKLTSCHLHIPIFTMLPVKAAFFHP